VLAAVAFIALLGFGLIAKGAEDVARWGRCIKP